MRYFFALFTGLTLAVMALLYAPNAAAQSFGVTTAQFFKRVGDAILPGSASWTIGSSGTRISTIYANTVDALSMAIGGVVSGDLFVSGNGYIYGSGGLQTPKLTATSTGLALQVDGRSLFAGAVTTTGGVFPATAGGADIGSNAYPYGAVYATGTSVFGGALTVTNGNGSGADRLQVGYEQSPAQGFMSTAPLNIYAPSTGYADAFTMTAGGNGADGACFAAKNLGATLGRQCQVSGTPSYYIMSPQGIAFQDGSVTPAGGIDMIINNNKVGIGINGVTPTAELEVQGTVSSTRMLVKSASSASYVDWNPGTFNLIKSGSQDNYFPFSDGAFYFRAPNIYVNGGTLKTENNDNLRLNFGTGVVSSTKVTLANGMAAAPSLAFSGDTDNGLYLLRANTPAVAAAGAHSLNFNDGWVSVGGVDFASMAEGDGYFFGDQVRGIRYISGGDFEVQGWHLNKFYISKTNGGTPIRFTVFDAPTNRVAMSDAGTLLGYTPNTALEVLGSGVSSTQLNVNGTSTLRTLMLGGNTVVDNKSPLYINYTQTQAMNDAYTPTVFMRNASTTAYTSIAFRRGDNNGDIAAIEVYNENSLEPEMPIVTANKMLIRSTSGTLMVVGGEGPPSAIAYLDENGAFRPVTGLGFGGGFNGLGQSASTTIVDGNYASASLNFPNSASADDQDLTITVAGAQDGDEVQCGIPNALRSRAREIYSCWVSAADTVTVRRTCISGAGCGDPAAATVGAGYFHRQ